MARATGFTEHQIRLSVALGEIARIRRSWLVSSDCHPHRLRARAEGGRLTCVSAASLRGLWVPAQSDLHIAVPPTAGRIDQVGLCVHWSRGPVQMPRTSGADDHPINILFHVSRCLPRADALAVWDSALHKSLVSADLLRNVDWRSHRARELSTAASALSESGIETHFAELMRGAGVALRQQVHIDGHRVDGLIGRRLVAQLDGFEHHRAAADRRRDLHQDSRLTLLGYTVLRFDYAQVLFQPAFVTDTVLTAIAQGRHR